MQRKRPDWREMSVPDERRDLGSNQGIDGNDLSYTTLDSLRYPTGDASGGTLSGLTRTRTDHGARLSQSPTMFHLEAR